MKLGLNLRSPSLSYHLPHVILPIWRRVLISLPCRLAEICLIMHVKYMAQVIQMLSKLLLSVATVTVCNFFIFNAKIELKWGHSSLSFHTPCPGVLLLFSFYSNYTAFTFSAWDNPISPLFVQSCTSWASGKQVCTFSCSQESGRSGLFFFHPTTISRMFILCQAL